MDNREFIIKGVKHRITEIKCKDNGFWAYYKRVEDIKNKK